MPDRRRARLALAAGALAVATIAAGCGGGDTGGRQAPDPIELESQIAQLRLEVQHLRRELASFAESVPTTDASDATTTTTASG